MREKILVLTAMLIVSLQTNALAQVKPEAPPKPTFANNQWSFDIAGRQLNNRETIPTNSDLDSDVGQQYGVEITAGFQRDLLLPSLYVQGSFRMTSGTLEEDSFALSIPTAGNIRDFNFRLGKAFAVGSNAQVVPYVGVGRRNWVRDTSAFPGGHYEQFDHNYVGAGGLVQVQASKFVVSGYGLVGSTVGATLAVRGFPVFALGGGFVSSPANMDFTLGSKAITMVGASVDFAVSNHWHINAGFDRMQFAYGKSPDVIGIAGLTQPDSTTKDAIGRIGFGYAF